MLLQNILKSCLTRFSEIAQRQTRPFCVCLSGWMYEYEPRIYASAIICTLWLLYVPHMYPCAYSSTVAVQSTNTHSTYQYSHPGTLLYLSLLTLPLKRIPHSAASAKSNTLVLHFHLWYLQSRYLPPVLSCRFNNSF